MAGGHTTEPGFVRISILRTMTRWLLVRNGQPVRSRHPDAASVGSHQPSRCGRSHEPGTTGHPRGDSDGGSRGGAVLRHVECADLGALAVAFNIFGLCDLVVAVGLGVTTSPGPTQLFHTTPTAEIMTRFPMALVPTFLVPLAFVLHFVSLWQLLGRSWGGSATGALRRPSAHSAPLDASRVESGGS